MTFISKTYPYLLISLYILMRFVFIGQLDQLGAFAANIFEAVFVLLVLFIYRSRLMFFKKLSFKDGIEIVVALLAGAGIFALSRLMDLPIPFDLENGVAILFLLLLGPVLEEFIFRQALWFPLEDIVKKQWMVIVVTSLIFAWGHFQAYALVPDEIKGFILYQTLYTFLIALWWGYRFAQTRALSFPMALHIAFNSGFYLAHL